MLKQDYKEGGMTMKAALALAVKVLNKTMDVSKLSAEKGDLSTAFCFPHHFPKSKLTPTPAWQVSLTHS